jgi:poly(hydroxyalkanoate) granule-associated protein
LAKHSIETCGFKSITWEGHKIMATKNSKAKASEAKASEAKADANTAIKGMANKIMESGQQIWLAGLGAFAKAQEEGGRLYEALIKEGSALEKITTKYTTGKVDEVRGAVENTVAQVKDRASDTWDKLEKVFEERVSRALGGLGIPGREELNELTRKVDELSKAIKGMNKAGNEKPVKAPVAKPAVKPAAKAAPVAKVAAKAVAKAKPAVKAAAKTAQSTVVKAAQQMQARASSAVANATASAKKTVDRATKAAQEAVKTVTDAVSEVTGN